MVGPIVNGLWGLGTAVFLRLMATARASAPERGSADRGGDRGAEIPGAGIAAEIGGARAAIGQHLGDRALDRVRPRRSRRNASSIIAPDQIWPIGLAMPRPAMSGAEPCTGSNIEGYSRSGLMLPEGAMPIEPTHRGPEIGQDVAEQIRADHDVEPIGMAHEMRGQDVDVVLVGLDVGVVARDRGKALVPDTASYG